MYVGSRVCVGAGLSAPERQAARRAPSLERVSRSTDEDGARRRRSSESRSGTDNERGWIKQDTEDEGTRETKRSEGRSVGAASRRRLRRCTTPPRNHIAGGNSLEDDSPVTSSSSSSSSTWRNRRPLECLRRKDEPASRCFLMPCADRDGI